LMPPPPLLLLLLLMPPLLLAQAAERRVRLFLGYAWRFTRREELRVNNPPCRAWGPRDLPGGYRGEMAPQGGERARSPKRQQLIHAIWAKRSSNPGV
jgi:hypothetical protein